MKPLLNTVFIIQISLPVIPKPKNLTNFWKPVIEGKTFYLFSILCAPLNFMDAALNVDDMICVCSNNTYSLDDFFHKSNSILAL